MKILARLDRIGNLTLEPASKRIRKLYKRELSGFSDGTVFVQECEDLSEYVPSRQHRWLREGHTVCFLMDPWVYGNLVGYDACEIDPYAKKEQEQ